MKEFAMLYEIFVPKDVTETARRVTPEGEVVRHDRTWSAGAELQRYHEVVDQIVLAEAVGFSHVWMVEHHFLEEWSHCSAPEVFLPYVAAKTSTIRLGHGVRLLPFPYNHPLKVAEQAAALDLLSNGRVELGTGRSATRAEMEAFGVDPRMTRKLWHEGLEIVKGAMSQDIFEWHGDTFDIPPRAVLPKPLQKPYPPLWCAGTSEDVHTLAGELGLGMLSFAGLRPLEEVGRMVGLYRAGIEVARANGVEPINDRIAVMIQTYCAEDGSEARRIFGRDHIAYNREVVAPHMQAFAQWLAPGSTYDYYEAIAAAGKRRGEVTVEDLVSRDLVVVGDPDECAAQVAKYFDRGVDHLILAPPFKLDQEEALSSIRLFGTEVIPRFKTVAA